MMKLKIKRIENWKRFHVDPPQKKNDQTSSRAEKKATEWLDDAPICQGQGLQFLNTIFQFVGLSNFKLYFFSTGLARAFQMYVRTYRIVIDRS